MRRKGSEWWSEEIRRIVKERSDVFSYGGIQENEDGG